MNIGCNEWLHGERRKRLEAAIAEGYAVNGLQRLVTYHNLAQWEQDLPTKESLGYIIFQLVEKCCREGKILDLVNAVASDNPGNEQLQQLKTEVFKWHQQAQDALAPGAEIIPKPSVELNQQPPTPDAKSQKRGGKQIVVVGIVALLLAIIIYVVGTMILPGIMKVSPDEPALAPTAVDATSQPAADAPPASACAALQVVGWAFDLTTATDQTRSEDANNRIVLSAEETAGLASISGRAVLSAEIGCDCTVTVDEAPMQQANCTFVIPQEGGNQAVELMVFVAQKPRDSVTVILGEP